MKNFISLLIITFSLLIISNDESYAQCTCPSGYTHTTETIYYNGTCEMTVEYCYKCDPTSLFRSVQLCSITIPWIQPGGCVLDGTDIGSQSFWEDIYKEMLRTLGTQPSCSNYEPCGTIPCSTSTMPNRFVEIKKSACFRKVEDPINHNTKIIACETEAQCVIEYCVCFDNFGNLVYNKLNSYEVGTSNCPKKRVGIGGGFTDPNDPSPNPYGCFNPCY